MSQDYYSFLSGYLDNYLAQQYPVAKPQPLPGTEEEEGKGIGGHLRDAGLSAVKMAIGVPELAVGLVDIPFGGQVGKFLENEGGLIGFRPQEAKDILSEYHTDEYKAQQQQFHDAEGVIDKTAVALANPSLITNTVIESAGAMGAGGLMGRGLLKLAPKMGAMAAGAAGEGLAGAGLAAEQIRQQTDDGLLTAGQAV